MTNWNLLRDPWIPVRLGDGTSTYLRPHEALARPAVSIDAPRADFQSNLVMFLIGLTQTAYAPADEDEWYQRFEEAPSERALREAFNRHEAHFNLTGAGSRFMQDAGAADSTNHSEIQELLLETPTGQTLTRNADLFVKRRPSGFLCWRCAATALYVLQTNAPEGGKGHMVSVRGGGPLTTIIEAPSLWATVWSNVLPLDEINALPGTNEATPPRVFPWLMDRIPGGKAGRPTTPKDGHATMAYWAMPRRLWLADPDTEGSVCLACDATDEMGFTSYGTAPNGFQYDGWAHPLAAYRDDNGVKRALRTPDRGMTYRDWLGLVIEDKAKVEPAAVVRRFKARMKDLDHGRYGVRAFGFRTKQNAVLAWHDAVFPLQQVAGGRLQGLEEESGDLVRCAQQMAIILEGATKQALFRRPGDLKGDMSYITNAYWSATNEAFYGTLDRLVEAQGNEQMIDAARELWHDGLVVAGKTLFDRYAMAVPFSQVDPKQVSEAWNRMIRDFQSKKVRSVLHLGPKERPSRTDGPARHDKKEVPA